MSTRHALLEFWRTVRRVRNARAQPARAIEPATEVVTAREVVDALRELDAIRASCRAMVNRRATLSAGAAVVPVPGLDVGADVAMLLQLLPAINEKFGLSASQVETLDLETKRVVMMFASSIGSTLVGSFVTREIVMKLLAKIGVRTTAKGVAKFVPLVGQAVSASLSFGAMRLLGNRHVDDCYEVARRALLGDDAPRKTRWTLVDRARR